VPILYKGGMTNYRGMFGAWGRTTMSTKFTILLAEDCEAGARFFCEMVKIASMDWLIIHACDGIEALEKLHEHASKIDAAVLDINMPRMSGKELLKIIHADKGLAHIKRVILTSSDDPREIQCCMKNGADLFLTKQPSLQRNMDNIRQIQALFSCA
jgi:CheY-like chemotaxis protein